MDKQITIELPVGPDRSLAVSPGETAGHVAERIEMAGYLITGPDGRIYYPEDDLYSTIESGQKLSTTPSPTGGKGGVEVPQSIDDTDLWRMTIRYQLWYSIAGLGIGLVAVLGGIALFLHGVAGSTSWVAEVLGAKSSLTDAPPGVVLFVVGLFTILVTRFDVKASRLR